MPQTTRYRKAAFYCFHNPSSEPGNINFPGTWVLGVKNPFEIIEILQAVSDIFENFEHNEIHDFFGFLKSRFRNNYSSANP